MTDSVVAEVTARLLYGSNGRVCLRCDAPFDSSLYIVGWPKRAKLCNNCQHAAYIEMSDKMEVLALANNGGRYREEMMAALWREYYAVAYDE